jgi:hypothetical protein
VNPDAPSLASRLRTRPALVAGALVLAVAAGSGAALLVGDGDGSSSDRDTLAQADTPTPEPTPSETTPEPSPSASPTPSATASPSASASASPAVSASASASATASALPSASTSPTAKPTPTPSPTIAPLSGQQAEALVRNSSSSTVDFSVNASTAWIAPGATSRLVFEVTGTDRDSYSLRIPGTGCGEGSGGGMGLLAGHHYRLEVVERPGTCEGAATVALQTYTSDAWPDVESELSGNEAAVDVSNATRFAITFRVNGGTGLRLAPGARETLVFAARTDDRDRVEVTRTDVPGCGQLGTEGYGLRPGKRYVVEVVRSTGTCELGAVAVDGVKLQDDGGPIFTPVTYQRR